MPITVASCLAFSDKVGGRNPRFPKTGEYGTVASILMIGTTPPEFNA